MIKLHLVNISYIFVTAKRLKERATPAWKAEQFLSESERFERSEHVAYHGLSLWGVS